MQHVVAASGFNVGIVLGMTKVIFSRFWGVYKVACLVGSIVLYVWLAGAASSLVRASLQASVAVIGTRLALKRVPASWALLLTVGIISCCARELLTSIGFQLSVLSTVAVIVSETLLPVPSKWLDAKLFGVFMEAAQITTVVQVVTLPLVWFHFGSVSMLTLPANTLLLWMTPFLMYISIAAAGVALIESAIPEASWWGVVRYVFRVIAWLLGDSFTQAALFLGQMEKAVVTLPSFSWPITLMWYGVVLTILWQNLGKKRQPYRGVLE
jgi:competence protein ComEC